MRYAYLLLLFFVFGCQKSDLNVWEEVTIKEGNHRSSPYSLSWSDVTTRAYEWEFNETYQYDLGDNDQCDWNKQTGASDYLLTNQKSSLMASSRWDLAGYWWLAPY